MPIHAINTRAAQTEADVVVVSLFENSPPEGPAAAIDEATGGLISKLLESSEIRGKRYEVTLLYSPPNVRAGVVAVLGLGKREELAPGVAYRGAGAAAKALAGRPRGTVAYALGHDWSAELTEAAVAGSIAGCRGQDLYRTEKNFFEPNEILWSGGDERAIQTGQILGESINLTRRLVNEPPEEIYPETFAQRAADVAQQCGLQVEIWDRERLQQERCGALLAVGRGSAREPRLVILRYQGAPDSQETLALVGKGVTFDSGGLSLKPSEGMHTMKCDMAGAATVLGTMRAIARLQLPVNLIGLMGLVENMTGSAAYKLGDVLTARNGITIEVLNTDAEGRLVLADVLDVAVTSGASRIVDLATLTGACVVALGTDVVGMMTNDQPWCDQVLGAAGRAGELAWQLPMFPEYNELIKSQVADIKNIGDGRWAGAITAAKLLERCVAGLPWTHIDIAGPAFIEKPKPWQDAGGTGVMVRSLVELIRSL